MKMIFTIVCVLVCSLTWAQGSLESRVAKMEETARVQARTARDQWELGLDSHNRYNNASVRSAAPAVAQDITYDLKSVGYDVSDFKYVNGDHPWNRKSGRHIWYVKEYAIGRVPIWEQRFISDEELQKATLRFTNVKEYRLKYPDDLDMIGLPKLPKPRPQPKPPPVVMPKYLYNSTKLGNSYNISKP